MKTTFFIFVTLTLVITSCNKNTVLSPDVLMDIDKEFSNYSETNGTMEAFSKYAADSAVLLRDNNMPVKGVENIMTLFSSSDNSTLTWNPIHATIASSGELGYTYGTYKYELILKDSTITSKGTYVTIWQKNKNNEWKWVLDCGTTGLY